MLILLLLLFFFFFFLPFVRLSALVLVALRTLNILRLGASEIAYFLVVVFVLPPTPLLRHHHLHLLNLLAFQELCKLFIWNVLQSVSGITRR